MYFQIDVVDQKAAGQSPQHDPEIDRGKAHCAYQLSAAARSSQNIDSHQQPGGRVTTPHSSNCEGEEPHLITQ